MDIENNLDNTEAPEADINPTEPTSISEETQPEAETQEETPEGEEVQETEAVEPEKVKSETPKWVQKKINKLTKRAKLSESENLQMRERLRVLEEPKAEEVDLNLLTDDERTEHLAEKKARAMFNEYQEDSRKQASQNQRADAYLKAWDEKIDSFIPEMPDYHEVLKEAAENSDLPMPNEVLRTIVESEIGPRIAYHLAKNESELERLINMAPKAQERHLLKLEIKLESQPIATAPKTGVTKASPTPKGRGTGTKHSPEPTDTAEWIKWKNAQVHGTSG